MDTEDRENSPPNSTKKELALKEGDTIMVQHEDGTFTPVKANREGLKQYIGIMGKLMDKIIEDAEVNDPLGAAYIKRMMRYIEDGQETDQITNPLEKHQARQALDAELKMDLASIFAEPTKEKGDIGN